MVVYYVDRLSRSLIDSSKIMDVLERRSVSHYLNGLGVVCNPSHIIRQADWKWTLPGESKWHKVAYCKAWSDGELADLLAEAGFGAVSQCKAWPSNTDALRLWVAPRD